MYGLGDKSVLEIILSTCSITENPPKPSRKAAITMFTESIFRCTLAIPFIPFVISKIPVIICGDNSLGIESVFNIGAIQRASNCNMLLAFKIEIKTEKNTIKPPIIRIVEIEFVMLFPIISPKFNKHTFLELVLLDEYNFLELELNLYFLVFKLNSLS